jgi:hypothetical protein
MYSLCTHYTLAIRIISGVDALQRHTPYTPYTHTPIYTIHTITRITSLYTHHLNTGLDALQRYVSARAQRRAVSGVLHPLSRHHLPRDIHTGTVLILYCTHTVLYSYSIPLSSSRRSTFRYITPPPPTHPPTHPPPHLPLTPHNTNPHPQHPRPRYTHHLYTYRTWSRARCRTRTLSYAKITGRVNNRSCGTVSSVSIAGINQCAYSIAGINQCAYSIAGINQCAYNSPSCGTASSVRYRPTYA